MLLYNINVPMIFDSYDMSPLLFGDAKKFERNTWFYFTENELAYVYAVATAQTDVKKAIIILERSLTNNKGDLQTLNALVFYTKELGMREKSHHYQRQMDALRK